MPPTASRAAVAPSPARIWLAGALTVILSLALLLAPRLGHAAPAPADAGLLGVWMSDKADPSRDYILAPGPSAGTLRITVPAKVVGRPVAETLTLQRISPTEFTTAKGAPVRATFRLTQPRHATFSRVQDDSKTFGIGYNLLEKR
jgi:hypothetical protein